MKLFERLLKAKEPKKEEAPKEEDPKQETISEEELHQKLKGFLYSDDIVSEYIHIFRNLYDANPEFAKVMEMFEEKEKQLNSINQGSEHFEQVTEPDDEPTSIEEASEESNNDYLMEILNERYGE